MPSKLLIGAAVATVLVASSSSVAQAVAQGGDWQTLHDNAVQALDRGEGEKAKRFLLEARKAAEAAGVPHEYFERSMVALARAQQRDARYAEAEEQYQRALVVREARLGPDDVELVDILNNLAVVTAAQERFDEAYDLTARVLTLQEAEHGPEHLSVGVTLHRLTSYAIERDRLVEAEAFLRRSLRITNAALGTERDLPTTIESFAAMHLDRGRDLTAEQLFIRALELHAAAGDDSSSQVQSLLLTLGLIYEKRGAWAQAEAEYERAFRSRPGDALALRLWLARARQGDRQTANRFLRRYEATRRAQPGEDWHRRLMEYLLGDLDEAGLLGAAESVDANTRAARRCEAHFFIASSYAVDGQQSQALAHFRRSLDPDARHAVAYRSALAQLVQTVDEDVRITSVDEGSERGDF